MPQILLIVAMSILARQAGGGLGAKHLDRFKITWLPELLFACFFGYASGYYVPWVDLAVTIGREGTVWTTFNLFIPAEVFQATVTLWSYLWMQTGHGSVLHWGRDPSQTHGRQQTLTRFVNYLAEALDLEIGSVGYCRLFMAVKGFLIGLPVGGGVLALLWPVAYEIGHRAKRHEVSELLSGAFAGLAILLFLSTFA